MSSYSSNLTAMLFGALFSCAFAGGAGLYLKSLKNSLAATQAESAAARENAQFIKARVNKVTAESELQLKFLEAWKNSFQKEDPGAIRSRLGEIAREAKSKHDPRKTVEVGNELKPSTENINGAPLPVVRLDITLDGQEECCFNGIGEVAVQFPAARVDEFTIVGLPQTPGQTRVFMRITVPQFNAVK